MTELLDHYDDVSCDADRLLSPVIAGHLNAPRCDALVDACPMLRTSRHCSPRAMALDA
ncbi:hypothetical protein [Xanthomonas arboricola]|uniref:hypothetical protein n=1 Tax=Xanthomonas arboricola TaxID=56448 RepID=UPI001AFB2567|nr:hypothetical protein [Xanthomonas arboricola]CAG2093498.1 hypothetical protein XCY_002992 [Xanthomonas arboricola pv. juglandis]